MTLARKPKAHDTKPPSKSRSFLAKVALRSTEEIHSNPRNVRTHSKKQIRQIARSIEEFDFLNPILVDERGVVLAGHGRLEAARLLDLAEVQVIEIAHLSDAEKRAYVLADNKLAENAGWDRELLALELGELAIFLTEINLDVELTGFSTGEIDLLQRDHAADERDPADEVDFATRPQVAKRGDVWQLGTRHKHRIACGDARSATDMAKLNGAAAADMVITDPPYNVRIRGHAGCRGKTQHDEFAFASGEMTTPDEYRAFLKSTVGHMVSVTRLGGLIYIFIDWRHVEDVLQVCQALDLVLRNICIWSKTTPGQGSFYRSAHEMIVVAQVPGGEATNNIQLGRHDRNRSNVWSYPGVNTFKVGKDDDLAVHPTVKPVMMIAEAIKDASARGAVILDPFLGSGSTLLACEKVGRTCHGLEYEPRYVDVAIRRWQQFTGQDAILLEHADEINERAEEAEGPSEGVQTSLCGLTFDEVDQARRPNSTAPGELPSTISVPAFEEDEGGA